MAVNYVKIFLSLEREKKKVKKVDLVSEVEKNFWAACIPRNGNDCEKS